MGEALGLNWRQIRESFGRTRRVGFPASTTSSLGLRDRSHVV